ncbi:MAG TPA: HlyD family secretion protein [Steroidobacteraceae bacterium]|nr:HlyD family secretion protein [Steroidobacteraceae bacterium]
MNAVVREKDGRPMAREGDAASRPDAVAARGQSRRLRERLRAPLMIGVPLIAAAAGLYYYLSAGRYQSTDDAYVRAAQVSISSNVSGRVSQIEVGDNQRVHRGEVLFRLDQRPFRIAVEEAYARLASARLQVESLKATYRQRLADLRAAQSALEYERREYDRQMRLLQHGITSQSQADRALLARNEAQQNVAAVEQQITATLASLGGDPNIPVERHPSVEQAQAELDRALLNLSYTTVSAPIDGIVTRVEQLQVGDYINAATPAFALVSTHDVWIEANFKEVQLAHMRPGDSARVWIDAYPDHTFQATVSSVSPGTGSEFSLLPPENATGNWVKVVQRLPVRLALEGAVPTLRTGLSATVKVDTQGHQRLAGSAIQPGDDAHDDAALSARAAR